MKKSLLIPLGILCLFIITNPSVSAFKDHLGRNSYQGLIREHNYFVYSSYRDAATGNVYNGLMGNFWEAGRPKPQISGYTSDSLPIFKNDSIQTDTSNQNTPYNFDIKDLSYKERVYLALKGNLTGFNVTQKEFDEKIKDREYDLKVYSALKENLKGFNKTPEQFISLVSN